MESQSIYKSGILVLILALIAIVTYEIYLRQLGHNISYDDSDSLFANSRRKIYLPQDEATVFIGSSRIKHDIDTETWKELTGETPVQLAFVGSRATKTLKDLAADPDFSGKVLMDVTEGLLFDMSGRGDRRPSAGIKYFRNETPAQRFSFHVNTFLESIFVFLDERNFSLGPVLEQIPLPPRTGFISFPKYPAEFAVTQFDRQTNMTENFAQDSSLYSIMRKVWMSRPPGRNRPDPTIAQIDSLILDMKKDIDVLRLRGAHIVFLRPPSSGPLWKDEQTRFPREAFWDKVLKMTESKGIHFTDYEETTHFTCPEYSHLSPGDSKLFTRKVIQILESEIGWKFKTSNQQ
jgi:hypothetical protein